MKNYTLLLLLILFTWSSQAQSYELDYTSFQQMRIAEWTSDLLPNITIEYDKRGAQFEPRMVNVYHQAQLIYTMEATRTHRILRDTQKELVVLFKPSTFVLANGDRFRRRITRPGKTLEVYTKDEQLIAKASILKRQKAKKKLKVEIIKPTEDNQALLTLMAIDLLEYFRVKYNPIY